MKLQYKNANRRRARIATATAIGALSLLISACQSGYHESRGTAAGAASGALIGGIIGHQSDETGKGAAIGAAAGAVIGREIGEDRDERERFERGDYDGPNIDFGELMTEREKERVRDRAGKRAITDWGYYLTADEKRSLLERSGRGIGD